MGKREVKLLTRALTSLGGSLLVTAAGLLTLHVVFAGTLSRASYDLPFLWRAAGDTRPVVLVYLDDDSAKKLNQPFGGGWDRALHTQLVDRLTNEGARLVMFDVVFDAPSNDPAVDEAFAEAIRRNGRVILGAAVETAQPLGGVAQERVLPPNRVLRKAAAAWGVLEFRPVDPDYGVRQMYLGTPELPAATVKAAEALGARVTRDRAGEQNRWVNYYGPPNEFSSLSFAQVIQPNGLPAGFFKDRIVLVGGRAAIGYVGMERDEFATPYTRFSGQVSTGVEVHATILLNLVRGEWLTRLSTTYETMLVLIVGLLLGGLALLRPLPASLVAASAVLGLTLFAWWLFSSQRIWCNWLVPVAIQVPLAHMWSVGSQYYLEARRRKELRRAFGYYLSSEMADKIADSDFDLTPGGKTVEATIMFTDLENFTTLSEDLDPAEVSQTLIEYFERTTRCILERKGTILKYVGDAVHAGWGAPIEQPDHAVLAAEAACDLRGLTDIELRGHRLRTRVGINTGRVLAGNLGSSYRFDYSMIGDTTNFAARLEALNKYLGTQLLIADSTRAQLRDQFVVRELGEFRVSGKKHSIVIHELICPCDAERGERRWVDIFEEGLRKFRGRDFSSAKELMHRTEKLRGMVDGPSRFYLKMIASLKARALDNDWSGIVEMSEK
ncbi:MAG TPA: adenylate/guanylate cyclase domain-containing protein [Chthoniobacterales bacterium]|nr:adenylate/guanylate cyclase domain-containing protein [Chthoniobacterales bacterium]